jgi:uncharacterized iron-regulated membrane protein
VTTKSLFRLHLWFGVATGVFMFIIGMSGAVAVFIEEIDWLVTPALRARAAADQPRASPDAILAGIRVAYPGDRINVLNISGRPAFAHVAKVQSKTRGNLDVFVDPVTGRINGDRAYSAAYTSTLRNFIRQMHLRLFMGLWGRVFVGVFGVTLVVSCVTGLWIYRGWFRNLFRLRWRAASSRTRWSDLHRIVGVWSLLFNVMIGVTGAVFGLENLTGQIRSKWLPRTPAKAEAPAGGATVRSPAARSAKPASAALPLDVLLARAREAFPDLAVRSIQFPGNAAAAIVLRGDVPDPLVQQSHVRRASFLALDPHSGGIRQIVDGRQARGWSRLYSSFDPLHFGYFGGMTTKIIWFVLGLAPGVLALSGSWLWWRRTRGLPSRVAAPAVPAPVAFPRQIVLAAAVIALAGAYVLVARAQNNWHVTGRLIEHAVAKPVAIALVAFPVTGLLVWFAWRSTEHRLRFTGWTALCVAWYLTMVTLFQ